MVIEWGHDSHIAFELSPMRGDNRGTEFKETVL